MNNKVLWNKVTIDNLTEAFLRLRYKTRVGINFLNVFGVRANTGFTNTFDDVIGVFYRGEGDVWMLEKFDGTTDPGKFYLEHPIDVNIGTGILAPGQFEEVYEVGLHQGKEKALVQRGKMKCYRDKNLDDVYNMDPATIQDGLFGCNLHNANDKFKSVVNDKWSAMCQVVPEPSDHKRIIDLAEIHESIYPGVRMDYTLLLEGDLK